VILSDVARRIRRVDDAGARSRNTKQADRD